MTAEAVRNLLHATPFIPFVIHVPDLAPVQVPHPDFAHVFPNGKTMVFYGEGGKNFRILDVALITQLELS